MDYHTDDQKVATFKALTAENGEGFAPFRWQLRLLDRFMADDLPAAVDIPTGLGKTAVMALWLMALARGADVPRRLVYVVDRRAVVDQATRFAERLRENTASLADDLGLGAGGLPISTLRGGFADNREWLEDPSRPTIVVGTVDMVGSRLLFEGYGVSRRMRPYHAGFLGSDTLVVLDEAHLCPPFQALLGDIATHRDGKFGPMGRHALAEVPPPFRLMALSATGREPPPASTPTAAGSVFRLQDEDYDEEIVRRRLTARKRLDLVAVDDPKALRGKMAERALELGYGGAPARVLVYCNSRLDALDVKAGIDKGIKARAKASPGKTAGVSELLVGERRVHERSALESWLVRYGFLGGAKGCRAPIFLVATSAGEVGVDLDADHMVCDLVAYERMVQRLGRVNRRGGEGREAIIDVFHSPPQPTAGGSKAERQLATYNAYKAVLMGLPDAADGRRDASPLATTRLRSGCPNAVDKATTPAPLHPALTRPHLEAWAMTSLEAHAGRAEVAPWLRGWEEEEEPHVNVVWRKYLPTRRVGDDVAAPRASVEAFFQSAPVHAVEKLEALRSHVTRWLVRRAQQVEKRGADHDLPMRRNDIAAVVIDRAGDFVASASLDEILFRGLPRSRLSRFEQRRQTRSKDVWERSLAGATLVVDARICGLAEGMLDEKCEEEPPAGDSDERWRESPEESRRLDMFSDRSAEGPGPIKFRVERVTAGADDEGLRGKPPGDWRHVRTFETRLDHGGAVVEGLAVYKWPDDPADEESRSILSRPQALRDHAEQVATTVRAMAERLGLPTDEVDALERAARLHDDGKAARRWQDAMNAPEDGRPYAKTSGGGNWRLLEGYRHEFGSVLKAELAPLPDETRDLILHLIAAHHGYARPLISSAGCEEAPPSVLAAKAGDVALRYARLQRRYGIWGLAWREAILRAADQSASREWSEQAEQSKGGSTDG